ncbi:protein of unknown function [Methanoculleus bourgensis]|uniref:Uncharacterized protein n=1 Tax=Methanoculleus bourgensis TaxID=83986 RepID=A0A0X3BI18_9EURY|nr:protein of unknown function [Methanoculleus bourgensis]
MHLILRVLAWITRKIAKGVERSWGRASGCTQGNTLLPGQWVDRGGNRPGGWGAGEGDRPLPVQAGPGAQTEP